MKIPKRIQPLIEEGLIDDVISRLMSGKEADVYVVRCNSEIRCAKVYKEAAKRGFKQAVLYREGRKSRNSRRSRAMDKGSKFGREQQEKTWHNAEVDALRKLAAAGVRVPEPYTCIDGVLIMELVTDSEGLVAPRLSDVAMSAEEARQGHAAVMRFVVQMLCAGLVHGDLSEFNILVDENGPVIIDLPQAVDAAANNNAESMLERDVNKISSYYGQFAPELLQTGYAKEIWKLYEDGDLRADTELTGLFAENTQAADVDAMLKIIESAIEEEKDRQERKLEAENQP
ncbi:MAG: serine protein kinase RIO [SAR86 cluster bacterium]|uniref:non-specific serine/threonine protein kinase n=1 Tax=SAR86 cluster bacterium TaxID=2030880 RepID=A0A2A4X2L8_9GAMM|nr:MAG: serine protein kinase RIO [SAR86 cluster bacterium]